MYLRRHTVGKIVVEMKRKFDNGGHCYSSKKNANRMMNRIYNYLGGRTVMKNCILMMMMWKDLQKFIKNGCNCNPKLFTLKIVCLVYERIIYDRSDIS